MAHVRFTDNIQRHVVCPEADVPGGTVREVLDHYFNTHADTRGYVLDDQGRLRKHMVVFLNGKQVADRQHLSDPVPADATIDVMQALSGG